MPVLAHRIIQFFIHNRRLFSWSFAVESASCLPTHTIPSSRASCNFNHTKVAVSGRGAARERSKLPLWGGGEIVRLA